MKQKIKIAKRPSARALFALLKGMKENAVLVESSPHSKIVVIRSGIPRVRLAKKLKQKTIIALDWTTGKIRRMKISDLRIESITTEYRTV